MGLLSEVTERKVNDSTNEHSFRRGTSRCSSTVCEPMIIFEFMVGKEHSYMTGLAEFLINNFAIFLLGAVLAQY